MLGLSHKKIKRQELTAQHMARQLERSDLCVYTARWPNLISVSVLGPLAGASRVYTHTQVTLFLFLYFVGYDRHKFLKDIIRS